MELVQVGAKTYYLKNPATIGIYKIDDTHVYLIDPGNDKDAGRKTLKIINTHSNADHVGGNKIIQDRVNCPIYSYGIEKCITEYPILEPSFLYGGFPLNDLRNKFLLAKESKVEEIHDLPEGLEYFVLKGHFFDMIGVKTDDDVYFLADSLFSEETIQKYHLFFIYDVKEYLNTLDLLSTLEGKLFIPSHCEATTDLSALIETNRKKIQEITDVIFSFCEGLSFEEIMKKVFDHYQLTMNMNQYVLLGSTIRSYLSYLCNEEKIRYDFQDHKMIWFQN